MGRQSTGKVHTPPFSINPRWHCFHRGGPFSSSLGSRVRIRLVHLCASGNGRCERRSPKNSKSDVHLEMGDAREHSPVWELIMKDRSIQCKSKQLKHREACIVQ